jgi:hypothetical protein
MEYCLSNLRHTEQWPLEADTYKHVLKCKERVIAWLRVEEVFGYVIDSWCDPREDLTEPCILGKSVLDASKSL